MNISDHASSGQSFIEPSVFRLILLLGSFFLLPISSLAADGVVFNVEAGTGRKSYELESYHRKDYLYEPEFTNIVTLGSWENASNSIRIGYGYFMDLVAGGKIKFDIFIRPGASQGFRTVRLEPFMTKYFGYYGLNPDHLASTSIESYYTLDIDGILSYERPIAGSLSLILGAGGRRHKNEFLMQRGVWGSNQLIQQSHSFYKQIGGAVGLAGLQWNISPTLFLLGTGEVSYMKGPSSFSTATIMYANGAPVNIYSFNDSMHSFYRGHWLRSKLELHHKLPTGFEYYIGVKEESARGSHEKIDDSRFTIGYYAKPTAGKNAFLVSPTSVQNLEILSDKIIYGERRTSVEFQAYFGFILSSEMY